MEEIQSVAWTHGLIFRFSTLTAKSEYVSVEEPSKTGNVIKSIQNKTPLISAGQLRNQQGLSFGLYPLTS